MKYFMKDAPQKKEVPAAFKQAQEAVDAALLQEIKKVPELEGYMRSLFTLRSGMRPPEEGGPGRLQAGPGGRGRRAPEGDQEGARARGLHALPLHPPQRDAPPPHEVLVQ